MSYQSKQKWKSSGKSKPTNWNAVPWVNNNKSVTSKLIENKPHVQNLCKTSFIKDNYQISLQ